MSRKPTPLCDIPKSRLKDDPESIAELVLDPRFICRKCLRVAHDRDRLCKPRRIRVPAGTDEG